MGKDGLRKVNRRSLNLAILVKIVKFRRKRRVTFLKRSIYLYKSGLSIFLSVMGCAQEPTLNRGLGSDRSSSRWSAVPHW